MSRRLRRLRAGIYAAGWVSAVAAAALAPSRPYLYAATVGSVLLGTVLADVVPGWLHRRSRLDWLRLVQRYLEEEERRR